MAIDFSEGNYDLSELSTGLESYGHEVVNEETFTAEIEEYQSIINDTWTTGLQVTNREGKILSRIYKFISLLNKPGRMQRIDIGRYDELYGESFYYLVMRYFLEEVYNTVDDEFKRWIETRVEMRQDLYYKHAEVGCINYERPYQDRTINVGSEGSSQSYVYRHYTDLNGIQNVRLFVGNAIAIKVECIDSVNIYKKDSIDGERYNPELLDGIILCDRDYLEIEFSPVNSPEIVDPAQLDCRIDPCTGEIIYSSPGVCALSNRNLVSHEYIVFRLYGEFLFNGYTPGYVYDTETLIHKEGAEYVERIKPPGRPNAREDFWNSRLSTVDLTNINNRLSTAPYISS